MEQHIYMEDNFFYFLAERKLSAARQADLDFIIAMALADAGTIVVGTPTVLAGPHPLAA